MLGKYYHHHLMVLFCLLTVLCGLLLEDAKKCWIRQLILDFVDMAKMIFFQRELEKMCLERSRHSIANSCSILTM